MTAIIDYDAGNIKSVEKALQFLGEEVLVTREPEEIRRAERVILPGVGAFGDAMEKLDKYGLIPVIRQTVEEKRPFLGICLGLQLLFESSEESPGEPGLGLLKGRILQIPGGGGLKVPHIGWNSLRFPRPGRLFQGIGEGVYVYFVSAVTEYGVSIHAAVEKDNLFACQFHPEKSSDAGLRILKNFVNLGRERN